MMSSGTTIPTATAPPRDRLCLSWEPERFWLSCRCCDSDVVSLEDAVVLIGADFVIAAVVVVVVVVGWAGPEVDCCGLVAGSDGCVVVCCKLGVE